MQQGHAKVIIVGAGPVGLALALALLRHQVSVLILEKEPSLCPESRAPGILPRTLEIFKRWGLLEDFLSQGEFVEHVQIWQAGQEKQLFSAHLAPLLEGSTSTPGLLVLPQDQTVRLLAEAVQKDPLAELRLGHCFVAAEQSERMVMAKVLAPDGQAYEAQAPYLVGCDGAHSQVREGLGWQLEGKTYRTRLMLADLAFDKDSTELAWPRFHRNNSGNLVAALKMNQHVWRMIASLEADEEEAMALSDGSIFKRAGEVLGKKAVSCHILWASVFRIHCRTSPHFWDQRRLLLAGDAAHINSPAGGQGMNSGIHDAHNLAWKLAYSLCGGDSSKLLSSYDEERRQAVMAQVARYTDLLTRLALQGPTACIPRLLRFFRAFLQIKALSRRLAMRAAMLDTRYKHSACLYGRHSLVGRRAPDGELLDGKGEGQWLHELLDPQAAMLVFWDGREKRQLDEVLNVTEERAKAFHIPHYVISRHYHGLQDRHALYEAPLGLWQRWHASHGLTVLLRPDAIVGWASQDPSVLEIKKAIATVLARDP